MRDAIAHRGPDGAGNWISPDGMVGLGHRRLAIVDLSQAASQPMSNEDGSLWISFNGEIYNHAEIRRELESLGGHRWKTDHSDTEVIVHAFEQWGIDCLQKFRGMFAIAIWDGRKRELWLVRDRIGIKPLYYSVHHQTLVFASEIKALLQDPEQPRAVNEESLYHYLSFLTTPAPDTLFAGIHKLPGGTWLRVRPDGSTQQARYWEVWDHVQPRTSQSDQAIAEELLAELRTSVSLRKMSDVPVGVFLSGGVDSTTNAVLFSEGEKDTVRTFSIGYDADYGTYPSELPYARQVARMLHAEHHERILHVDDLVNFVPRMIQLQDEPIGDPVCVPLYYVSELARKNGVTVCQVGEGADELFWGYSEWKTWLRLQEMNDWPVPRFVKRLGLAGVSVLGYSENYRAEQLRRGIAGLPIFWGGKEAFTEPQKRSVLSPRLRTHFAGLSSWDVVAPIYQRFCDKSWEKAPLQWMTFADLNLRLPEMLLMRVDKMSMGVSLEARVPFLDHKFVELTMSIPAAVKTRNGELKHILKRAVRGLIPGDIIDRKKQGFGVPIQEWFTGRLGEQARSLLTEFCRLTDYFDPQAVQQIYFQPKQVGQLWPLMNFALWWNEYIAPGTLTSAGAFEAPQSKLATPVL
ncbi:MAG TPA: asparagine synthase (glutamine-hydrolyzing), partial [Candidatus Angelobacter sp.]|nr:asparagine synthase (glutamine-hydrolyzing) [Candidatus Angelobacter sp.]